MVAAAPGTHQAVAESVEKYCGGNCLILELGAYTGGHDKLRDIGYSRVMAADLDNHLLIRGGCGSGESVSRILFVENAGYGMRPHTEHPVKSLWRSLRVDDDYVPARHNRS